MPLRSIVILAAINMSKRKNNRNQYSEKRPKTRINIFWMFDFSEKRNYI